MSSSDCPSLFHREVTKFQSYSLLKKILYFIHLVAILGFSFWIFNQNDKFFLYIPTGLYMKYIEYIFLILIPIIAWYMYQKKSTAKDICKHDFTNFLKKYPLIHLLISFLLTTVIMTLVFYMSGIAISFFNIEKNAKKQTYSVIVKSVGTSGNNTACNKYIKTDFLEKLHIKNMTFFHKTMQAFHFDQICTRYSNTTQYIYPGEKVRIDVMETPWGVYVYNIP